MQFLTAQSISSYTPSKSGVSHCQIYVFRKQTLNETASLQGGIPENASTLAKSVRKSHAKVALRFQIVGQKCHYKFNITYHFWVKLN